MTLKQIALRAVKTFFQVSSALLPADWIADAMGRNLPLDAVMVAIIAGASATVSVLWNAFFTWMGTWDTGEGAA